MKRIASALKDKWPEYLLEILVITIGVLGAFLLNSWSESAKAQREQSQIIENLHEEFQTNLASLDRQIFRLNRKVRACNQIFCYLHPTRAIPDSVVIDTLVQRLYDNPTWNPSTYVLTDLRNSGQLKSLKNQKLKLLLHQWEQHYENLREWYQLEMNLFDRFMALMVSNGSSRNALFYKNFGSSDFQVDNYQLFRSYQFENHLSHNLMITAGLLNIYESETVELINQILEETE